MTMDDSPRRWPRAEHRSAGQLSRDTAAATEQVRVLRAAGGSPAPSAERRILLRQPASADGPRFISSPTASVAGPVVVAENQLIVQADGEQLAGLRGTVLAGYADGGRAGRGIQVLRSHGKSLAELQEDIASLKARHITANINMVLPLGYVVKADSYPAPTESPGHFPAAAVDPSIRVAIVDTGRSAENRSDAWFTGVVAAGTDPLNEVAPWDRNDWFAGHGTFTAGIVRQLAETCEIVVYRFTGPDGLGTDDVAADTFLQAAEDAARDGCRLIINASFGAPAMNGSPPLALQEAIRHIATRYPEVLIVASAGNDGGHDPVYPAGFSEFGVKAVGALNADLTPALFSNSGDWVDCSTVGVGVVSTYVQGRLPPEPNLGPNVDFPADAWATWSGTSFTAPQVSAAVAQLCAESATLDPHAAFDQLLAEQRLAGRPQPPGFGTVVHLLPGTPAQ